MMWHDGYGYGWGWGGWIVMGVLMVVVWGVVIAAGFAIVQFLRTAGGGDRLGPTDGHHAERAEALLAERFARGEIDKDEYHSRLAVLREARS